MIGVRFHFIWQISQMQYDSSYALYKKVFLCFRFLEPPTSIHGFRVKIFARWNSTLEKVVFHYSNEFSCASCAPPRPSFWQTMHRLDAINSMDYYEANNPFKYLLEKFQTKDGKEIFEMLKFNQIMKVDPSLPNGKDAPITHFLNIHNGGVDVWVEHDDR